jgi:hypothetical protein
VDIEVPDECFEQAERLVAEINVAMKAAKVSGEIVMPEGVTVKKKTMTLTLLGEPLS